MLLCDVCGLPMSVCSCWLVYLDEQRDNYEADWPYRYDPAYDWDAESNGDDPDYGSELDDPLTYVWYCWYADWTD